MNRRAAVIFALSVLGWWACAAGLVATALHTLAHEHAAAK